MATNRPEYSCFIDESGDEGFKNIGNGSSEWFFLGGVVVDKEDEPVVRSVIDTLRDKLWTSRNNTAPCALHWVKLDHEKKIVVAKEISQLPFTIITVGIWKPKLDHPRVITQADYLFRYASRFLLERICWLVSQNQGWVKITFSNRTRFSLRQLQGYLDNVRNGRGTQFRKVFDPNEVKVVNSSQLKMLQVADICVSAVGQAFNPDGYGNIHPYYIQYLGARFYRRNGKLFSYGMKMFPDAEFLAQYKKLYPFVEHIGC